MIHNYMNDNNNASSMLNIILAPIKVAGDKISELISKRKLDAPERVKPDCGKIEQFTSMLRDPIHIIDKIYLGNAVNAASYYKLKDANIGLIINVTSEITNFYEDQFEYLRYPILDNGKEKISDYLLDSYNNIIEYMATHPDQNILVHCYMGASRSVSIIVFYMMKHYDMNFDDAFNIVSSKKEIANISTRFRDDIIEVITKIS
jgi:protein-tyrosine phosphatase